MPKWGALYVVFNDADYIEYSITSLPDSVSEIVVLRTLHPWNGPDVELDDTSDRIRALRDPRVTLIEGDWRSDIEGEWLSEIKHRSAALDVIREKGCDFSLIVDGDEVYETARLARAMRAVEADESHDMWRTPLWTYWKSPLWRIDPPEPSEPIFAIRVRESARFTRSRNPEGPSALMRERTPFLHHFSYAKPSEEIREKVGAWGHSHELRPRWWEDVWLAWDSNHKLKDLNPVFRRHYNRAIYSGVEHLPEQMRNHPYVVHGVNGLPPR